jgi:transcriptional regulator with XRE-family HTH domain
VPRPLREIRAAQGLTQQRLAELIGVTYLSVSNWENGYNRPRDAYVAKLAEVLHV